MALRLSLPHNGTAGTMITGTTAAIGAMSVATGAVIVATGAMTVADRAMTVGDGVVSAPHGAAMMAVAQAAPQACL